MEFLAVKLRRYFDTGDNFKPTSGGGTCRADGIQNIVVGDGQRGQTAAASQIDDLGRRVDAVAGRGVNMQIDAARAGRPGHLLTQAGKWLTGRHVKIPSALEAKGAVRRWLRGAGDRERR